MRRLERALGGHLSGSLAVFALNSVLITLVMRLWHADLRTPFGYSGDAVFNLALVRGVIDNGWFLSNPDLAYPFGQGLAEYAPSGDNLTFVLIRALALFTSDPALIVNLVYILSFPVIAVVTFLVLRRVGLSAAVAVVCATLYALAPYHFLRGQGHVLLGFYYTPPLAGMLVLDVLAGRPLFSRRALASPRWLSWASRRSLGTLAICAVIASGGVYYGVFALVLLTAVLVVAILSGRREAILTSFVLLASILAVQLFNLAPGIIERAEKGTNPIAGVRAPFESELYGLKLMDLVLPTAGHRIEALDQRQAFYHRTTPLLSEPTGALGIVGTVGFGWLLLVALATLAGDAIRRGPAAARDARELHAAFATIVAFVVGTTGGVSALFAYAVTAQIRGWGRISIVIAFFAVFAVGLLLDRLRRRMAPARLGSAVTACVLATVLLVGILDQTNRANVPNYAALNAEFSSDATFVKAIRGTMAPGAAIMQLPYVPFPENPPVGGMSDYDHLRPYVHGGGLRWTYGAMKGRAMDWQQRFFGVTTDSVSGGLVRGPVDNGRPAEENLAKLIAAGIDGVYVDRAGYGGGVGAAEGELQGIVGQPPIVSPNGRMAFYEMAPYAERLRGLLPPTTLRAMRRSTITPLGVIFGAGFHPPESDGRESWRWAVQTAQVEIDNPSSTVRLARLRATIETGTRATITITRPDGAQIRRRTGAGRRAVRLALDVALKPGPNTVRLVTDAPPVVNVDDARPLFMRFVGAVVEEPSAVLPAAARSVP